MSDQPTPDHDPKPEEAQDPQLFLLSLAVGQFDIAARSFEAARRVLEQAVLLYTKQHGPTPGPAGGCPVDGCTDKPTTFETFGGTTALCPTHGTVEL